MLAIRRCFPHAAIAIALLTPSAAPGQAVALVGEREVAIEATLPDPNDLWVLPAELTRINGFELKPEGLCRGELCIPVLQDEDGELLVTRGGRKWVSVTGLARRLGQAFAADHDLGVWSFGASSGAAAGTPDSILAPDFALPDADGDLVRLSDFRGRKVLILTWASW